MRMNLCTFVLFSPRLTVSLSHCSVWVDAQSEGKYSLCLDGTQQDHSKNQDVVVKLVLGI